MHGTIGLADFFNGTERNWIEPLGDRIKSNQIKSKFIAKTTTYHTVRVITPLHKTGEALSPFFF